jgi:hypothetical protein
MIIKKNAKMALFELTPTKLNGRVYTTPELLNTKKVGNFREQDSILYFSYFEKSTGTPVEYQADLTHNEFISLLKEEDNERWVYAHALSVKPSAGGMHLPFDQDIWIDTDRLARAWEVTDGLKTRTKVQVDDGGVGLVEYKLANDLSALDEAASQSTSLSFSL